ncbi:MAG: hypothetical protein GQ569_06990 [Methylococcaceae bacterium]|nr:hypothetical protein [Methylococcaceae bacterium]
MTTKWIIVICEGAHDIAFLERLLKINGFKKYKQILNKFPEPFKSWFLELVKSLPLENRKLGYQKPHVNLPVSAWENEEAMIFFHNATGDSHDKEVKDLLNLYQKLPLLDEDGFPHDNNLNYRFLIFQDADEKGIKERCTHLSNELECVINQAELTLKNNHEIGGYIFHNSQSKKGTLEDLLLELINLNELAEQELIMCEEYLKTHQVSENRKQKFNFNKSLISILGQLQISGVSNAVIIEKIDSLQDDKLKDNLECQKIMKLF